MRKAQRVSSIAAALAAAVVLGGCATADPDSSQAVLHYSGGSFSSQNFVDCITPGTRQVDGAGDYHFYYPNGRRTFDFTGGPGSDADALKVATRNANGTATEVSVRGVVTFSLVTDCAKWTDADGKEWAGGKFMAFHDNIGRQHHAFAENGGEEQPPAWKDIVRLYVGGPTEKALDNVGPGYDWQQLSIDSGKRNALQDDAAKQLPELIEKSSGGPFFVVHSLQVQSVDAPQDLKDAQNQVQTAQIAQQATVTDEQSAANFPGGILAYTQYLLVKAQIKALNEGRGIPVPLGSNINVPAPGH
jgi:hypothetical protein